MDTKPTPGTLCSICTCCPADFVCGDGTPLCWACDSGEHEQSKPAAVKAAEPEPEPEPAPLEEPMEKRVCACGCGTEISGKNGWQYARGHKPKNGAKQKPGRKPKPIAIDAEPEETEAPLAPVVALELDEQQLDRIWTSLPIEEKALAISTALTAVRD